MSEPPVEPDPVDESPDDAHDEPLDEPLGDPVLSGDPVIDQALVLLDELDGRDVGEHPQAFEHVHRVLRDSLSGLGRTSSS